MDRIQDRIAMLAPEEIREKFNGFEAKGHWELSDLPALEALYEHFYAAHALSEHERAMELLEQLTETIRKPDWKSEGEDYLDLYEEWALISLAMIQDSLSAMPTIDIYRELFEVYADTGEQGHREARFRIQLLHHFENWKAVGGNPEILSEADRNFIAERTDDCFGYAEAQAEAAETRGEVQAAVKIWRGLFRFYAEHNKPNDAIGAMKTVIGLLPDTDGYIPADSGDRLIELGQFFMKFKKYSVAKRYFNEAKDMYEASGEDFEMFATQAEGWMEEAESFGA